MGQATRGRQRRAGWMRTGADGFLGSTSSAEKRPGACLVSLDRSTVGETAPGGGCGLLEASSAADMLAMARDELLRVETGKIRQWKDGRRNGCSVFRRR